MVLAMHTFPSREALTPEWGQRMAAGARRTRAQGLLFTDEAGGLFAGPVRLEHHRCHGPGDRRVRDARLSDGGDDLGDRRGADRLAREVPEAEGGGARVERLVAAAGPGTMLELLEPVRASSATTGRSAIPSRVFNERCFIGFESDETLVYRLWDVFQDVAIWSSDYPHHDAEDAWDAPAPHGRIRACPSRRSAKLLGENARRLYGIEPLMTVKERIEDYDPAILPW